MKDINCLYLIELVSLCKNNTSARPLIELLSAQKPINANFNYSERVPLSFFPCIRQKKWYNASLCRFDELFWLSTLVNIDKKFTVTLSDEQAIIIERLEELKKEYIAQIVESTRSPPLYNK